jgi:hypothetical protein
MNYDQIKKYRFEWARVKAVLAVSGMKEADMEAKRHELHIKALGEDKSSTLFNDKEMDNVLREFRAISSADDLRGQIELGGMDEERKRHSICHLLDALGSGNAEFIERWISRRQRAGRMLTVQGPTATFETIGLADLEPLFIDLKKVCRRRWPRKGDLLTEIRVLKMSREFDEDVTKSAICAALRTETLPPLEKLDYEALLIVISTLKTLPTEDIPF